VMHHHEVHKFHKDDQPRGPFLHRVHRALMSLGPWEGRIVAFETRILNRLIGVLIRMVWVLTVLLVRGARGTPEREETILVCTAASVAACVTHSIVIRYYTLTCTPAGFPYPPNPRVPVPLPV
jgi:hypothetical protein